jgi:hypothetical protein
VEALTEHLFQSFIDIKWALNPSTAHRVLRVEDVVQGFEEIRDVLRSHPSFLLKLEDPIEHCRSGSHVPEWHKIRLHCMVKRLGRPVEFPVPPLRLSDGATDVLDDVVEVVHFNNIITSVTSGFNRVHPALYRHFDSRRRPASIDSFQESGSFVDADEGTQVRTARTKVVRNLAQPRFYVAN